jgi:hypothetical protein
MIERITIEIINQAHQVHREFKVLLDQQEQLAENEKPAHKVKED